MTLEGTGRSEFAKFMTDHIFSDINRYMLSSVVNSDGVTNEARQDGRSTGPGFYNFLIVSCVQRIDLLYERESDERAFFYGSGDFYSSLSYLRLLTISLVDAFLLCLVFTP